MMLIRLVALLLLPAAVIAQRDTTRLRWVPNPRVANGGWVSDPARHLQPATVSSINDVISALERESTAEIAVVVIDSLDGLEPADAAMLLHRRWGVGKAARDNGVVLLWSPRLRKTFVSVGYGLEGVLPDARAGRIQDEEIIPRFRNDQFDEGIRAGVNAIAAIARTETYAGAPRARIAGAPPGAAQAKPGFPVWGGVSLIAVPLLLLLAAAAWSGRPRKCPKGHGRMRKLDEAADDKAIGKERALEERLGSMNYDVWACGACDAVVVVPHRKWLADYQRCDKCQRRTVQVRTKTITPATYHATGFAEVTLTCRNCGWTDTQHQTLPMLVRSGSSSSGGSGFSGGGGSSFGGGSSGGGGAGRSY
jgi:uncharacterized protein